MGGFGFQLRHPSALYLPSSGTTTKARYRLNPEYLSLAITANMASRSIQSGTSMECRPEISLVDNVDELALTEQRNSLNSEVKTARKKLRAHNTFGVTYV